MEAKETVMSDEQIEEIADPYALRPNYAELLIAQAQAEISFKAGIKEVVEWIEEHSHQRVPDMRGEIKLYSTGTLILTTADRWQKQLKEWGIE